MARPTTATETLDARGSWRGKARRRQERAAAAPKKTRRRGTWRTRSEGEFRDILCLIPGYDPFATAEGYTFKPDLANRALAFFHRQLVHIEGAVAGRPFVLETWQQAFIANLFGWVKWSPRWQRWVRRYREALLYVPRKNGKSPLVAGLGL